MQASCSIENGQARIVLAGDFTFEGHQAFKQATQQVLASEDVSLLSVDFDAVDYMDSAALGMLLLLKERFGERPIQLLKSRGTVRAVLDVANFGRLFQLD
ncbi:anti-anti-sigma factor [Chitinimonas taiwanensis DSM 18899]|jgi:HptB-dependent secretion and biofilm anti anti-sigma factor|uniref:Anti-anti-sigma factor n=2 Tax=Chitinimonas TaxID=240411 RepID=A0A1K2H404_9NEIS|nr:anti-anti-sigma factor [Chitinimonas taiwanensis DSM 18899]